MSRLALAGRQLYGGRHRTLECVYGSRARSIGIERLSRLVSSS
jgi:hypothetical protein